MKNKFFINQIEPLFEIEEKKSLNKYMSSNAWLTEYEKTYEFEKMIAEYTNSKYCIMTNNGTISLTLIALALGFSKGDEIIVPNYTMIATANSIKLIGAKPVFVDVEEDTLCLDLKLLKNKINQRTKAIFLVSPNGRYPLEKIEEYKKFCKKNNIFLVEDAAQSLGSYYPNGNHIGTEGVAGAFSLSVPKIISTGQGGMVVTNDEKIAKKMMKIKDFGRKKGGIDIHNIMGYNFKFTDLQAVVGIEQLKKINKRISLKKKIYLEYIKNLKEESNIKFFDHNLKLTSPLFVDCLVKNKSKLKKYLYNKKIGTRDMYPPINEQRAYKLKGSYPISKMVGKMGLWLPSSLNLNKNRIKYICDNIKRFYD